MGGNFDLFGDPVPDGHGGRGRPEHLPTAQNRNKVMMMLAFDWPDAKIAKAIGVSEPTLRKYYFSELAIRQDARARLEAAHMGLLWEQATEGNVSALKEFRHLMDRNDLRIAERDFDPVDSPSRRLGKKEAATLAAETAGDGSEWGDDLLGGRPN